MVLPVLYAGHMLISWRVVSRNCDRSVAGDVLELGDELARLFPFAVLAGRELTGDEDAT